MLREALLAARRARRADRRSSPTSSEAVDAALRMAQPGDLLLIFADTIARTWKQVIHFQPEAPAPRRSTRPARRARAAPAITAQLSSDGRRQSRDDDRGVRLSREAGLIGS